jgi:predicted TIM-barrel fold metal-dependent hydrolase
VLVPADHTLKLVNLYERRLDPFWAACCDVGLPVTRHSLFVGPPETPETGPATDTIGLLEVFLFFKRGLTHLLLGAIFERFPDLKFVFTETFTNWVPPELQVLDMTYERAFVKGTTQYAIMRRAIDQLSMTPSEYYKRNVWLGASLMTRADVDCRHEVGVDRLIWGSDYPHHEGSWPHTRMTLRWNFWDVPEEEVRMITSGNAADVYDFDLDFLQGIADKIGPTPEDLTKPVSVEELPEVSQCFPIAEAIATLAGTSA